MFYQIIIPNMKECITKRKKIKKLIRNINRRIYDHSIFFKEFTSWVISCDKSSNFIDTNYVIIPLDTLVKKLKVINKS